MTYAHLTFARSISLRPPFAAVLAAAALLLTFMAAPSWALTFPPLTGRVVDDAHVLSAQTQADLTAKLADLEAKTGRQLVVVTLPDLQGDEIEDYGYQLGRAWGIGQKGQNNGVLFIVAPSEHKVRIEVGYGLEPILTDALSSVILQTQVLPKFRSGDVQGGVVAGTNAIIDQLSLDQTTAEAKAAQAAKQQQEGGGNPAGAIFAIVILFIVLSSLFRSHWGGGGMGWLLPMMILSGGRRGDGWGDRDDGGGGGGFSGGGGSFGGGGASGSW